MVVYLSNWVWLKGRDNQNNLATWQEIFQFIPRLEFCKVKSSLDGCDLMLHNGWLDIPSVVIIHSFCFKPRMVSDKNIQRNIFIIIFLGLFHKGITTDGENSYYLPNVLVLGQELILGKPSNYTQVGEVISPLTSTFVYLSSRFMPTRFGIFMIYKHMYNHPFKIFINWKYEGVEDLMCGNREIN